MSEALLQRRKYRFIYGYKHPDQHPECPDFEGEFYVELSDADVIEEGETSTEAGFLVVAMDRFVDERNSMENIETEEYELRRIEVVPVTIPVTEYNEKLKKLMEDYTNEADSMTDCILCWLDEDDSHALTDGEIQALINFAGDEDYVTVEDIRHMASNDAIYNVEPYKNMRAMLDVMKELGVGSDHFAERMKSVERCITADSAQLESAKSKREVNRYVHRVDQLRKYRSILNMFEWVDRVESSDGNKRIILLHELAKLFNVPVITAEQKNEPDNVSGPGQYGSDRISGVLAKGETVLFDGVEWIVVNIEGNKYTLMKKTIDENVKFGDSTNYRGSFIADKCVQFQNLMSSKALTVIADRTVCDVTAQVWVPTKTDIEQWTDTNDPTDDGWYTMRKWESGDPAHSISSRAYWCSNQGESSRVCYIDYNGFFSDGYPGTALGFRPCIEVIQNQIDVTGEQHVPNVT